MGHQVVFGPPGTGKTRTLIEEVRLRAEVPESRVLVCSHTKAAAQTAMERWGNPAKNIDIQTLHSFCFRATGCSRSQTVDDQRLIGFLDRFGMDLEEGGEGRQYVELMALARAVDEDLGEIYESSVRPGTWQHFKSFVESYKGWKKTFGYVDFPDMLERYIRGAKKGNGFTFLAIDEAQDMTPLHWQVVHKIMELNPDCQVMVAGDDDQCIYSYQGADAQGMLNFADRYDASQKILEQSYRVPFRVHQLAQRIVKKVEKRVAKSYLPRAEDGSVIYNTHDFEYDFKQYLSEDDTRDVLILYSDKFIRRDHVEMALMDLALPFYAVSGFPSPMQSKAGQALKLAHKESISEDETRQLFRALNDKGAQLFKAVGPDAVIDKLRHGDLSLIPTHWSNEEYFRRVDWNYRGNIRISTIHGAKGMEAATVHLITGQSGAAISNSFRDPDSQHRLFYVGATRASETLCIYPGDSSYEMPRGV